MVDPESGGPGMRPCPSGPPSQVMRSAVQECYYTSTGQELRFLRGLKVEREQGCDRRLVLTVDPVQAPHDRHPEPGEVLGVPTGQALLLHELPQPLDQVQVRP